MCGFVGYYSTKNNLGEIIPDKLKEASRLISHRGPDEETYYVSRDFHVAFRRLSIQDINKGSQPFKSKSGNYILVLNGEIYNHLELRETYLKDIEFYSTSDAETIVELIDKFGVEKTIPLLNGMFSITCFNSLNKFCYLIRDRFGVKPLYYYQSPEKLFFSSELSPIISLETEASKLDILTIYRYLIFWYSCEPNTFYKEVEAVKPGTLIKVSNDCKEEIKWWKPEFECTHKNYSSFIDNLDFLLKDSVKLRMISDVPISCLLSGGIDSGLVCSYWNDIDKSPTKDAFSLGFNNKSYDELINASKQANKFGINLITSKLDKPTIDDLTCIYSKLDQPIGNSSFIGSYYLFKMIDESNYKVCLTGDGADELFGGYPTYQMTNISRLWDLLPSNITKLTGKLINKLPVSFELISFDYKIKQFLKSTNYTPHHPFYRCVFTPELARQILSKFNQPSLSKILEPFNNSINQSNIRNFSLKNQALHLDFDTFLLNDHLPKIDRASMAFGVEARNPFLDYRIYNLAFSNPHHFKFSQFKLKKSLKTIGRKRLHPDVLKGKKKGLTLPIAEWLASDLGKEIESLIIDSNLFQDIFSEKIIKDLFNSHRLKRYDHSRELWALTSLYFWTLTHRYTI